jgi:hypothetical protein
MEMPLYGGRFARTQPFNREQLGERGAEVCARKWACAGSSAQIATSCIGSGQGFEGFGTEEDGAAGPFDEMEFAFLHGTVQGAGGEASEDRGCVNREHDGLRAARFAVQKDALFLWPQDGGFLPLYKDFDVPRQLQSCTVFLAVGSGGC